VTGFDGRVPTSTNPDLRVVFSGMRSGVSPDDEELDAPAEGWRMVFLIGRPWDVMMDR
jgi:hypothetical protein